MSEFKNCPFCGKLIASDATVCNICGKELTGNNNTENTTTAKAETFKPSDAFSYMFTDKKFIPKAIALYLVFVIAYVFMSGFQDTVQSHAQPSIIQILGLIAAYLVLFIMAGYSFSCVKALTIQNDNYTLPFVDIIPNFITGFKSMIAMFIGIIVITVPIFLAALIIGLVPMIVKVIVIIALLFVLCKYLWVAFSFYWIFAQKNYLTLFFKYKLGREIIANSKGRYLKGVLCIIIFSFLGGIIGGITGLIGGRKYSDD